MTASVQHVDDMDVAAVTPVSFRLFGALVGLAICSSVFNNVFEQRIASIGTLSPSVETLKDVREAIGFIPALRLMDLQPRVLGQVMRLTGVDDGCILAGIGAVGFFASLFTRELTLERGDLGRQQFEKTS